MSARDDILASIRENRPQATRPLPDVPLFDARRPASLLSAFKESLERMGGLFLDPPAAGDVLAPVRTKIAGAKVVCSTVPEIAGNRDIAGRRAAGVGGRRFRDRARRLRRRRDRVCAAQRVGTARQRARLPGAASDRAARPRRHRRQYPSCLSASGIPLQALRVIPHRSLRHRGHRGRSYPRRPGGALAFRPASCKSVEPAQPLNSRIRERARLPSASVQYNARSPRPPMAPKPSGEIEAKIRRSEKRSQETRDFRFCAAGGRSIPKTRNIRFRSMLPVRRGSDERPVFAHSGRRLELTSRAIADRDGERAESRQLPSLKRAPPHQTVAQAATSARPISVPSAPTSARIVCAKLGSATSDALTKPMRSIFPQSKQNGHRVPRRLVCSLIGRSWAHTAASSSSLMPARSPQGAWHSRSIMRTVVSSTSRMTSRASSTVKTQSLACAGGRLGEIAAVRSRRL